MSPTHKSSRKQNARRGAVDARRRARRIWAFPERLAEIRFKRLTSETIRCFKACMKVVKLAIGNVHSMVKDTNSALAVASRAISVMESSIGHGGSALNVLAVAAVVAQSATDTAHQAIEGLQRAFRRSQQAFEVMFSFQATFSCLFRAQADLGFRLSSKHAMRFTAILGDLAALHDEWGLVITKVQLLS